MGYENLFDQLWEDYIGITPSAARIQRVFAGDVVVNDHIALRTFDLEKVNLEKLAGHFKAYGYEEMGTYRFEEKKLNAKHFAHPDQNAPKVFISELSLSECSDFVRTTVESKLAKVDEGVAADPGFLFSGRHWDISFAEYQELIKESEYAAWTLAWGYHANHFTVDVNALKNFSDLESVNSKLKEEGFTLNTVGGEIKGTPESLLEQSSTVADIYELEFSDGLYEIPSCFYEFAFRHRLENGELFQGFVTQNADKIFESTNAR
ncbi:MAG: DUF1338 domain-containing protein [Bdellovibrionales bacterium]